MLGRWMYRFQAFVLGLERVVFFMPGIARTRDLV